MSCAGIADGDRYVVLLHRLGKLVRETSRQYLTF